MENVTIIGGGYAGVWAALSAAAERNHHDIDRQDLIIQLISNDTNLVARPCLYEGATAELQVPLQPLFDLLGINFIKGDVRRVDSDTRSVIATHDDDEQKLIYGKLILASGSQIKLPSIPGVTDWAFNIDTFASTKKLDQHMNETPDLTVAVIGASFTGIEFATGLRNRYGSGCKILLLDQNPVVGQELGNHQHAEIMAALKQAEVEVHTGVAISEITATGLKIMGRNDIFANTVVLTTGLEASPLQRWFDGQRGKAGRLHVNQHLQLSEDKNVYAAGDIAYAMADDEHAALMSCQHAMPMGKCAGSNAVLSVCREPQRIYRQEFYQTCMDLGPRGAVLTKGWDRRVEKTGADAKALKQQINKEWIYPPSLALGRDEIFKQFAFEL